MSNGSAEERIIVEERAARVKLLLFDVDGVLTDGVVVMHADGTESKGFHIRDGAAIVWAQRAGLTVGFLSSRASGATTQRAAQLAVRLVIQGVPDKGTAYEQILRDAGLDDASVAYMGDDLVDIPVLSRVGLAAAPLDGAPEVRERVHWTSTVAGGRGAVREFIEMVLRAQSRWDAVTQPFLASS